MSNFFYKFSYKFPTGITEEENRDYVETIFEEIWAENIPEQM